MAHKRYFLHAVTPVHLGAGRGLGYIDLPVAREASTNWPYIPGSSVKGVIADAKGAHDNRKDYELAAFGGEYKEESGKKVNNAGSLAFTDAHILCLPVRSFFGTFAWITSPFCLRRFYRDGEENEPNLPVLSDTQIAVCSGSVIKDSKNVYLEDLDLAVADSAKADSVAKKIADALFPGDGAPWHDTFVEHFAIVSDTIFTFLCESGTEVTPHIRINDETGIVKDGALWYEETLPVETILSGTVWCDKAYQSEAYNGLELSPQILLNKICESTDSLQLGGKASTGKGIVRLIYTD